MIGRGKGRHRFLRTLTAVCVVLSTCLPLATVSGTGESPTAAGSASTSTGFLWEEGYLTYAELYKKLPRPDVDLRIPAADFTAQSGTDAVATPYEGKTGAILWTSQDGWLEYTVTAPTDGMYRIALEYYPLAGRSGNLEFELSLDGAVPFREAGVLSFQRIWVDDGPIRMDNRGNQLRPSQVDAPAWIESDCRDKDGIVSEPFLFHLTPGAHTVRLRCIREKLALGSLRVYNQQDPPTYAEYAADGTGITPAVAPVVVQGEAAARKSDPGLYPVTDRSSPLTQPYDPAKIRLNTIGGYNWRYPGQWIEWDIDVPADGNYEIVLRERQDQLRGLFSNRRITLDGKVPFQELSEVRFPFSTEWRATPLGGETPYVLHLTAGPHTLRMETVIGSIGPVLNSVERDVYDLNALYRRIIMITGVTPDIYQSYDLAEQIPELLTEFVRIAKSLEDEVSRIEKTVGAASPETALLTEVAVQLRNLAEFPDTISERLERYKTNVSALSAWMLRMREQPLEIDYLMLAPAGTALPRATATIWEKLVHDVRSFFSSFFENYDLIGDTTAGSKPLTVWVGSGRDQAQIVKTMIDDQFTAKTGIQVNVSLVQGTLLEATMAGKGPDIALNVARYLPVDLAVRGALLPLEGFPGFAEDATAFQKSAFVPYSLQGHVYAMPETQEFNMLFYRKDIFAELGIEPPDTWEDLLRIIPAIERRNMDVGIPSLVAQAPGDTYMPFPRTFGTLLIQQGLDYYKSDLSATTFTDPKAIEAFVTFTDFYREYGLPVYYDFANRFRTGEMPIGIASYTMFNYLSVSAPEIRGTWAMVPIPGTRKSDGSIDRSEEGYGSACVVFEKVASPDDAYAFVSWWTSEETQTRFGREMESLMGPAARYPTANQRAFANLPWSFEESQALMTQWSAVRDQPEIPGSYFVSRNLTNAIIDCVYANANPLSTLEKYTKYIDGEITRKRIEFGMTGG